MSTEDSHLPEQPPMLLTAREVAQLLRLHEKTIRRMIREGRIPCVRLGRVIRFRADDIDRWLRKKAG